MGFFRPPHPGSHRSFTDRREYVPVGSTAAVLRPTSVTDRCPPGCSEVADGVRLALLRFECSSGPRIPAVTGRSRIAQPKVLAGSRSEAVQGGVMAGVRDRGPRRRSDYYAEQPDRVNASQHAALGGRSREPVSILGSIRPCRLDGRYPCGRRP